MSTPISFNTDLGIRLRPVIIETLNANGTPLGIKAIAESIELDKLGE